MMCGRCTVIFSLDSCAETLAAALTWEYSSLARKHGRRARPGQGTKLRLRLGKWGGDRGRGGGAGGEANAKGNASSDFRWCGVIFDCFSVPAIASKLCPEPHVEQPDTPAADTSLPPNATPGATPSTPRIAATKPLELLMRRAVPLPASFSLHSATRPADSLPPPLFPQVTLIRVAASCRS